MFVGIFYSDGITSYSVALQRLRTDNPVIDCYATHYSDAIY